MISSDAIARLLATDPAIEKINFTFGPAASRGRVYSIYPMAYRKDVATAIRNGDIEVTQRIPLPAGTGRSTQARRTG